MSIHRRARTIVALALVASAVSAVPASAQGLVHSSGTIATPPKDIIGDLTLNLGPAGKKTLSGVKQFSVSFGWNTRLGDLQYIAGAACAVDHTLILNAGFGNSMNVGWSYVKDNPAPTPDEYVSESVSFAQVSQDGDDNEFGVCYDD